MENDRLYAVASKLTEYVKSPSLRHIRDPHVLQKLAKEIVQAVDRASSVWEKWKGLEKNSRRRRRPAGSPQRTSGRF